MTDDIKILYEDSDVMVCRKPSGLPVQSARVTSRDMESILRSSLYRKNKSPEDLHVVHRLDTPVEGIIVFALNKKAAADLSRQVQQGGTMNKEYLAYVHGFLPDDKRTGKLRDFLIKDRNNRAVVTDKGAAGAKEAILSYEVLVSDDKGSVLKIHLETGRYHQIRAQLSNAGYPILGDNRYGSEESIKLSKELGIRNVALCAYRLSFVHPSSGERMDFEITPSGRLSELLNFRESS